MRIQRGPARILCLILAVFLSAPLLLSETHRPAGAHSRFVCGTGSERERNVIGIGLYQESRVRQERARRAAEGLAAPGEPTALQIDVGDVAVIEDDGTMIVERNFFNLQSRALLFEPVNASSYRVVSSATAFSGSGGTRIVMGDDTTSREDLGFSFPFYGASYASVQVNSDGNLTFNEPDTATSDRDLGRFAFGPPRIGPFFADLDPSFRGTVSLRRDPDGTIFIWNDVPRFGSASSSNSFSVKLFPDGRIEFVYATRIDSLEAVVGVSPGGGRDGITSVRYSTDLPTNALKGTIAEVFVLSSLISETAIAKRFLQSHPDDFDHLNLFLSFDFDLDGAFAYALIVKNEIQGIGMRIRDDTEFFGSNGRLRSFLNMGTLTGFGRYPADPFQVFLGTNSTVSIMGQEAGHRWLAYPSWRDGSFDSRTILGRDRSHWSFFFDSDGSVMEGNDIEDRGPEFGGARFRTVGATDTFSALDQYLIGLRGKDEVPNMFVVENPSGTLRGPSSAPAIGIIFGGTRREVTIDSIIQASGDRNPTAFQAPKVFRQAFILLARKGQPATPEQIQKVQNIRNAWVRFFNEQTGGRGWIVTDLQDGPGTTPSTLHYPHFRGNQQRYTGIALANWGATPAEVVFRSFDNDGSESRSPAGLINPRRIAIGPQAQIALLDYQIFGLSLQDARDGRIEATSSSSQVTGFFLEGDLDQNLLDGAAVGSQAHKTLYFTSAQLGPRVVPGAPFTNLIVVINPGDQQANLTLRLVDETGATRETAARTMAPRGRIAEDLASLFPGSTQPRRNGYVVVTSNVNVIGYQRLDNGSTNVALPAQPSSAATVLYSAQFASGPAGSFRYFTDLNFINTSSQDRTLQLLLVRNDGTPAAGPVNIPLAPGAQRRERGEALFNLPDPIVAPALIEGSLVVTADGPGILGEVTFGDPGAERFLASLPLDGAPRSNMVLSQVAQGGAGPRPYFTGIAVYNPNPVDVSIRIEVFSERGEQTGTRTLLLARGSRISQTLPELVPGITGQIRGYIRVSTTGGPVIAFELFGNQQLDFLAAVPPQPIAP